VSSAVRKEGEFSSFSFSDFAAMALDYMRPEDLIFAAAAFTPRRQESAGEKDSDRKRSAGMSEARE
jgi:hypothetical protein